MFQALLCPSSGARDYDVVYHIGRVFLALLYVGGEVQLGWSGVRVAGSSLQPVASSWIFDSSIIFNVLNVRIRVT